LYHTEVKAVVNGESVDGFNWIEALNCNTTSVTDSKRGQEKLLEKTVKFQGVRIFLNTLMSAKSPAAKFMSLGDLLKEKELTIADPVPISNAYNEGYYKGENFVIRKLLRRTFLMKKM